jgi:hypothetical protein
MSRLDKGINPEYPKISDRQRGKDRALLATPAIPNSNCTLH